MHFEDLLLSTLLDAKDPDEWRSALETRITAVTGDDAAMALLGLGADLDDFRELFAARAAEIHQRYVAPLDTLDDEVAHAEQALDELRQRRVARSTQLWRDYKPDYERLFPAPAPPARPPFPSTHRRLRLPAHRARIARGRGTRLRRSARIGRRTPTATPIAHASPAVPVRHPGHLGERSRRRLGVGTSSALPTPPPQRRK